MLDFLYSDTMLKASIYVAQTTITEGPISSCKVSSPPGELTVPFAIVSSPISSMLISLYLIIRTLWAQLLVRVAVASTEPTVFLKTLQCPRMNSINDEILILVYTSHISMCLSKILDSRSSMHLPSTTSLRVFQESFFSSPAQTPALTEPGMQRCSAHALWKCDFLIQVATQNITQCEICYRCDLSMQSCYLRQTVQEIRNTTGQGPSPIHCARSQGPTHLAIRSSGQGRSTASKHHILHCEKIKMCVK